MSLPYQRRPDAHIVRHQGGYILEYCPSHPGLSHRKNPMAMQHRLVMEGVLDRLLSSREVVHHIDGNPGNNRPDNLLLFRSQAEHVEHHWRQIAMAQPPAVVDKIRAAAADPKASKRSLGMSIHLVNAILKHHGIRWRSAARAHLTESMARRALRGKTTIEAARQLGVSHQTLRNLFPHLLLKRNAPGWLDNRRAEIRMSAIAKGVSATARDLGIQKGSLYRMLKRWQAQGATSGEPATRRA